MKKIWFYGLIFVVSIAFLGLLKEGFSDSMSWSGGVSLSSSDTDSGWIQGIWSSVFREKPYVIRVESDPLSIPTATYVPTRQPCLYPPCPAPDVYQSAYN